jgi:hypothetical protein
MNECFLAAILNMTIQDGSCGRETMSEWFIQQNVMSFRKEMATQAGVKAREHRIIIITVALSLRTTIVGIARAG